MDRVAIADSLFALATCLDEKDWVTLAASLTDDTQSYGVVGVAETVARVRYCLDACGLTQHLIGNVRIEQDGRDVAVRSSFRAFHAGIGDLTGATYECLGDYDDRWRRTADGWRLAARTVRIRGELGDRSVIGL
ncbi:nuclear transport factor 2 family protein [Rhodococcus sp. F64268]|uniref:nuclear transport factor 2 family protein n=1 Tax=Rhodococcus sp. F64268 TaxID=2926402 RepID=UPI001FF68F85|nr:nuclear transport factor 2 family protein [Rhodococcus sp. F64268]MCK0090404.1 nuclear transport factor 2 family protein [Rhodococcus sp. F64268]